MNRWQVLPLITFSLNGNGSQFICCQNCVAIVMPETSIHLCNEIKGRAHLFFPYVRTRQMKQKRLGEKESIINITEYVSVCVFVCVFACAVISKVRNILRKFLLIRYCFSEFKGVHCYLYWLHLCGIACVYNLLSAWIRRFIMISMGHWAQTQWNFTFDGLTLVSRNGIVKHVCWMRLWTENKRKKKQMRMS